MPSRVLLITPLFYGIEKEIVSSLEKSGYEVEWIENKNLLLDYHGTRSKCKFFRRIYYLLFSPQTKYLNSEFKNVTDSRFDILFAINAHVINHRLIKDLKRINPDLVSILYLWDSSGMYKWEKEIKLFDNVFTFDSADSLKYGINYKPNFYLKNFSIPAIKNDLFFVGKYSFERKSLIDKIINHSGCKDINLNLKLFPAYKIFPHNFFIYNCFKKFKQKSVWIRKYIENFEAIEGITDCSYISPEQISYNEFQEQLMASNVILDIPYEFQKGYTHRVIQSLAFGKKILTTNKNIMNEAFFDPDQIHILDSRSPEIESSWIKTKSVFPVNECFKDLELSAWLKSILNASII